MERDANLFVALAVTARERQILLGAGPGSRGGSLAGLKDDDRRSHTLCCHRAACRCQCSYNPAMALTRSRRSIRAESAANGDGRLALWQAVAAVTVVAVVVVGGLIG